MAAATPIPPRHPNMPWIAAIGALVALYLAGWLHEFAAVLGIIGFIAAYVLIRRTTVNDKTAMVIFTMLIASFIILPMVWNKYQAVQDATRRRQIISDILAAENINTPGSLGIAAYYTYCLAVEDAVGRYMSNQLIAKAVELKEFIRKNPQMNAAEIAQKLRSNALIAGANLLALDAIQKVRSECKTHIQKYAKEIAATTSTSWLPETNATRWLLFGSMILAAVVCWKVGGATMRGVAFALVGIVILIGGYQYFADQWKPELLKDGMSNLPTEKDLPDRGVAWWWLIGGLMLGGFALHYVSKSIPSIGKVLGIVGVGLLVLSLLLLGHWAITRNWRAGGIGGVFSNTPPPPQQDPRPVVVIPDCVKRTELPSGEMGHFCSLLNKGVKTKIIKPPHGTWVRVSLTAPGGEIEYFNYDDKYLETKKTDGPEVNNCFPRGAYSFRITLKEEGTVTMRVTGQPIVLPGTSPCS